MLVAVSSIKNQSRRNRESLAAESNAGALAPPPLGVARLRAGFFERDAVIARARSGCPESVAFASLQQARPEFEARMRSV
jgi:hypothetical protein